MTLSIMTLNKNAALSKSIFNTHAECHFMQDVTIKSIMFIVVILGVIVFSVTASSKKFTNYSKKSFERWSTFVFFLF
jgi:hypothetical protein